jgi:hypothetical protein
MTPKIFVKTWNGPIGYWGARVKLIREKNLKSQISCQAPFKTQKDFNTPPQPNSAISSYWESVRYEKIAVTTCEGVMQNWPLFLPYNRGSGASDPRLRKQRPKPRIPAPIESPGGHGDFLHIYVQCSNHGFRKLYIMPHIKLYQVEKCSPQVRL